ncbi:hypothetical protein IAT38_005589 [Cryptococcus sp. DSM 104549]
MPPLPPDSPPSPSAADRPRPTIADISLPPRRPLRDGTSSSASSAAGSRGRSRSVVSGARSRSGSRGRVGGGVNAIVEGMLAEAGGGVGAEGAGVVGGREVTGRGYGLPVLNGRTGIASGAGADPESDSDSSGIVAISPIHRPLRLPTAAGSAPPRHGAAIATARRGPRQAAHSSSSEEEPLGRRFTAKEKGKGRAVPEPAIEIGSDSDTPSGSARGSRAGSASGDSVGGLATPGAWVEGDSAEVVGLKRKRRAGKGVAEHEEEEGEEEEEEGMDEKRLGTGFMCPICFSAPNPAIVTPCGHILCAGCLHSSLTAAIRRNPNPFPEAGHPGFRGGIRGRGGRGGRGAARGRGAAHAHTHPTGNGGGHPAPLGPGPDHWTEHDLRAAFLAGRDAQVDKVMSARGWPREEWASVKEAMFGEDGASGERGGGEDGEEVEVKEVLRGLWMIRGRWWVVEGECPVCRRPLPGGYGPVGSGIGGIVPLEIKVSTGAPAGKKRRVTPKP